MKRFTEISGNVFADLGLRNPEQELLKARLTLQIYRIIRERKMTQTEAARFSASSSRMYRCWPPIVQAVSPLAD